MSSGMMLSICTFSMFHVALTTVHTLMESVFGKNFGIVLCNKCTSGVDLNGLINCKISHLIGQLC
jgi:hypothetical protein